MRENKEKQPTSQAFDKALSFIIWPAIFFLAVYFLNSWLGREPDRLISVIMGGVAVVIYFVLRHELSKGHSSTN